MYMYMHNTEGRSCPVWRWSRNSSAPVLTCSSAGSVAPGRRKVVPRDSHTLNGRGEADTGGRGLVDGEADTGGGALVDGEAGTGGGALVDGEAGRHHDTAAAAELEIPCSPSGSGWDAL